MSCKLYLVPEDVIHTWQAEQRERKVNAPLDTAVTNVDSKMQHILQDKNLSDYDKEKLFSQELGKYMSMREQKHQELNTQMSPHRIDTDMLTTIPKTFRNKAAALLNYLQADKDIKWDDRGQLIIEGQLISNSHIVDLIHDALRSRKKVGRAKGWRELSSHLKRRNIPKELIGNREWFYTPPTSPTKEKSLKRRRIESADSYDTYGTVNTTQVQKSIRKSKPRKSKVLGQKKIKHWISIS